MSLKTKVGLRRWPDNQGGDLIALFPEIPATLNLDECEPYMFLGQHGAANYDGIIQATAPADPNHNETKRLVSELTALGYDLDVVKRAPRNAYETRRQAIQAMAKGIQEGAGACR